MVLHLPVDPDDLELLQWIYPLPQLPTKTQNKKVIQEHLVRGGETNSWTINPLPRSKGFSKLSFVFLHSVLREPQLYKTPETVSGRNWNPRNFFLCSKQKALISWPRKEWSFAVNTVYWQLCSQTNWKCFLTSKLPPPPTTHSPTPHRFFSSFHKPQRQKSTLPKLSETNCPRQTPP
jgi:hypothetical protein